MAGPGHQPAAATRTLTVSIDLDCCLWHHQSLFRALIRALQSEGHAVGILTSHKIIHEPADRALLRERGFPEPDFYHGRPLATERLTPASQFYARAQSNAELKAAAILANRIDYHFDDGDAPRLRELLGQESWRVIEATPRGREGEHYE